MVLHNSYRELAIGGRVHVLIRYLTCPFLRVVNHLPHGGTLLEIGGGHGAFATLAAVHGMRSLVVEPDLRKVFAVGNAAKPRFVGGFDDAIRGTFDAVAILDVFYAIPIAEWDALLARLHARVAPGGVLLVKEMDPLSWKQRWNRLQESISMRFLGITYAVTFNYEAPSAFADRLRRAGFASVEMVPVDAGYPHPHLLFVARP